MGKKTKIVLDTSILVSALGWQGNPHKVFKKVITEDFDWYISYDQLAEINKVLEYPRLKLTEEQKQKFFTILYEVINIIEIPNALHICDDPNDDMIIETAVLSGAKIIVSGDDDLLRLKKYKTIDIITAREFLEQY